MNKNYRIKYAYLIAAVAAQKRNFNFDRGTSNASMNQLGCETVEQTNTKRST